MPKHDSFIPFLTGIGVGVAAAVILAPASGRKTRARIGELSSATMGAVRDSAASAVDAAGESIKQAGESVKQAGDYVKQAGKDAKQAWRNGEGQRNEALTDLRNQANQHIDHAVQAGKKAADVLADSSRDIAHAAGKQMEQGGKKLQDV